MAVTREQVEKAFNDFQKAHNNNIPVKLIIANQPKDIYGERITEKDNRSIEAAFYPVSRRLVVFTANIRDEERLRHAINHELVGHYGINTLKPTEKRDLLERISQSREQPTLKPYWQYVDREYSKLTESKKAEEIFAFIAEYSQNRVSVPRTQRVEPDLGTSAKPLNKYELRAITESIDNGITAGIRPQRTFPKDDQSQFSKIVELEPIKRLNFENPERAAVQEKVASAVEANPQKFLNDYRQLPEAFGGRYIGADLFKETFDDYKASKENRNLFNNVVHNSAAVLSSAQLKSALQDNSKPERDTVVFLTGVPGAGKTSTVLVNGEPDKHYRAIFEGQMSNAATTIPKIQSVLDAGLKAEILVVHANSENALDNTLKRFGEVGRGASVNTMANIQGNLPEGLEAVKNTFGDKVKLTILDVRDREKVQQFTGWKSLPILRTEGNQHDIKQRLTERIEQYREQGRINEPAYHQAIGNEPKRSYGRVDEKSHYRTQENDRGRGLPQGNIEAPKLSKVTPYSEAKNQANFSQNTAQKEVNRTSSSRLMGRK